MDDTTLVLHLVGSKADPESTMIAKYPFRSSDVLPTLVLAEQLQNSDRHRWDIGDQQHADAQYD